MTVRWIAHIFDQGPTNANERLVMLALADYANDEGECWPSIAGICRKSALKNRGVQGILRRLEAAGWIEIVRGGGRKNCNLYRLKTPHAMHPAQEAPPQDVAKNLHPVAYASARHAPEPSKPLKEPSEDASDPVFASLAAVAAPDAVRSFLTYRRTHKANALTETGAKRLAASLVQIRQGGGDPSSALGLAEERGWSSVQADWYFRAQPADRTSSTRNVTPEDIRLARLHSIAGGIKQKKPFLYQNAAYSDVMEAVRFGLITEEQASEVGFRK
jgi:hypothetical protein